MKKILQIAVSTLVLSFFTIKAQNSFQWAKAMGSNNFTDRAYSVVTDASGNVYSTGFFSGVGDFDPGAGSYTLSAPGNNTPDVFISKLDASGNFIWAHNIGSGGIDMGRAITLDLSGNLYVTGNFSGTVDFDPGPGVFNLTSTSGYNVFILKLDQSGNFIWARNLSGTQFSYGLGITSDNSGNVYTTGYFTGVCDFDPGSATYTLAASGGNNAVFISKLNSSGNFVWAKNFVGLAGSPNSFGYTIKAVAGNIYTGGNFAGTLDFNPGAGTYSLQAGLVDGYISKLDTAGNFVWAKNFGTVGTSCVNSIAFDAANNIYMTGFYDNTADFDPGSGTTTLSCAGSNDAYISKWTSSGNFLWVKAMGGTGWDEGKGIAVSNTGDIFTTGFYTSSCDMDPGPSVNTFTCLGGSAVYISDLDANGNFVNAYQFAFSNSGGGDITLDQWNNIYTAGWFDQTCDADPGPGTFTLTAMGGGGSQDIVIHKMTQSICPTFSINSSTNSYTLMCANTSLTLNAVNTSTFSGVTYTWTSPSMNTATGSAYTSTAAGIYTVAASAPSNTCIVTQTLSIIQTTGNVSFNVTTSGVTCFSNGSASITINSGNAPYTFTWSSGGNSSTTGGLAVGNYTATVTDAIQCSASNTFAITNVAPPFSSVPICFVTVDSISQHNVVTWDKTQFPNADSFYVYREIASNTYSVIQRQPYSTLSRFVDTVKTLYFPNNGNPNIGTYRYKLKTVDSCGNFSSFSPYHNTLFIVNNNGTFSWPQLYAVEGSASPVVAYVLERDNLSNGNWQAIGSVAATQQFIIDPSYSAYQTTATWRVRTQWNIFCVPTVKSVFNSSSFSNQVSNLAISIKENSQTSSFAVYPQPASGEIFITTDDNTNQVTVKVNDLSGKLILTETVKLTDHKGKLNIEVLAKGIYILELTCNNKTAYKKLTVTD